MQPTAKFNACHFLQDLHFTNSVSFVDMAYGGWPILAKKEKKMCCFYVNPYFSLEEEKKDTAANEIHKLIAWFYFLGKDRGKCVRKWVYKTLQHHKKTYMYNIKLLLYAKYLVTILFVSKHRFFCNVCTWLKRSCVNFEHICFFLMPAIGADSYCCCLRSGSRDTVLKHRQQERGKVRQP